MVIGMRTHWILVRLKGEEMDRTKFLGASEAGAVLGISPYRTPFRVWQEKVGLVLPDPPGIPARAGNALENLVLDLFQEETGKMVSYRQEEFEDDEYPFLKCHVDGLADSGEIVEAKTTGSDKGWGEPGTDQIPQVYLAQVTVQMYLAGLRIAYVPVLIGREDFRIYKVERDEELEKLILPRLVKFWTENVEKKIAPPPVTLQDIYDAFPRHEARQVEATEEIHNAVRKLSDIQSRIKALEKEETETKALILSHMQSADELVYGGKVLATWRTQNAKRLNNARLKELYPKAVEDCTGEITSRVFRLKKSKEE